MSEKPCILAQYSSSLSSGTSDGWHGTMLCPSSCAILYPDPVEPVSGYDRPPVHMMAARHSIMPDSVLTPQTAPFSQIICFALSRMRRTPLRSIFRVKVPATSFALSETGNTLFPRSVLSGSPSDSKNCIVSRGGNLLSALYKNFPSPGILLRKSFISQLFVTLQRPLPVMRTLRPSSLFCSSRITSSPRCAAMRLHIIPAAPPPMITASALSFVISYRRARSVHRPYFQTR